MGCIIAYLDFKYDTAPCEGSEWSLHSVTECVAVVAASHKTMTNRNSYGTWCPFPDGLQGVSQLKNLQPGSATQRNVTNHYKNCVDACIRLHLSSIENENVLKPGQHKNRFNTFWNNYREFRDVTLHYPPFENNRSEYTLAQFGDIEKMNKISLVLYDIFVLKRQMICRCL